MAPLLRRPASLARLALPALMTLAFLCVSALHSVPAQAEEAAAEVTVVHAVPGLTVDVYVDGSLALPGFEPGTITDPLPFEPGTYELAIVPAGGDLADAAIAGSATVAAGDKVSLVAHLAADGTPTLTAYADDLSLAGRHAGRVVVRHVAAAPAVDVRLTRRLWYWRRSAGVLENLENGQAAQADVDAGSYEADIAPAGSEGSVFGPAPLRIRAGTATFVYAYGSLADGTFGLLTKTRDLRAETARLRVVHGVPGLTVDVYLNGELALPGFTPRTITDPIDVPGGTYDIVIVAAGGDPSAPVLEASASLGAGSDSTAVAHLDAAGAPTISLFANDLRTAGRHGRLVVRHVAAAPAVDVQLVRRVFWWRFDAGALQGATNGTEASKDLYPGMIEARITPAGDAGTTVLGPAKLAIRARAVTYVYAIGSLADGTLDLLVERVSTR
jgi:hypothetical protein